MRMRIRRLGARGCLYLLYSSQQKKYFSCVQEVRAHTHVHTHKTWEVETQDHQHVNSAGEPSRNFSAFLHTLLGLHWERGKGETPLGPEGDGGGPPRTLTPCSV